MDLTKTKLQKQHYPPIPPAPFAKSLPSRRNPSVRLPQAISHRGYKALHPENSMTAFAAAVAAGTHAIETDLHLSADGEVVLSHDADLKRCFGVERRVADCDWEYLSTLRTLRAPHVPIARLRDLLEWLLEDEQRDDNAGSTPESRETASKSNDKGKGKGKGGKGGKGRDKRDVWLLLDVKVDDDPGQLFSAVKKTLNDARPPAAATPWHDRVVVGCWNQPCLEASLARLPGFPAAHISFSPRNSFRFLESPAYPGLSFNVLQQSLVGPFGARFQRAVRGAPDGDERSVFAWTVNDEFWMEWAIGRGLDGVVTDDPAKFLEVLGRRGGAVRGHGASTEQLGRGRERDTAGEEEEEEGAEAAAAAAETKGETDSLLGANGKERDAARAPAQSAFGWRRWGKLYLQAFAIQVFIVLATPWLGRNKRWSTFEELPNRPSSPVEGSEDDE